MARQEESSLPEQSRLLRWAKIALVAGLLGTLYGQVLAALAGDWWNDPAYSHGLLIPPLALYLAWGRRALLVSEPAAGENRGLLLTAAGCLLFLAGRLGAEFFITRVSLVVLLTGLIWTFWGRRRVVVLGFPLLLLTTMIPLPAILYNAAAAPLQLAASQASAGILQIFSVPVYRDGNILHLPQISLGVAEACSGLRSLTSLVVLALLAGHLWCSRAATRVALLALTIPIAIGVNILRVAGTALLADHDPDWALGFYHLFSGWLVFVAGFGLLLAATKGLKAALERRVSAEAVL